MIAFRPVPPEEGTECMICDSNISSRKTGTKWDAIVGRFSQVEDYGAGTLQPVDDVQETVVVHFYCYIQHRSGNARIRYGIVDAQVAIWNLAGEFWEPFTMTENDLTPICGSCNSVIMKDSIVKQVENMALSYFLPENLTIFAHEGCTFVCGHCDVISTKSRLVVIDDGDETTWEGCRKCFMEAQRSGEFFDCSCCGRTLLNDSLAWEDNGWRVCNACEDRIHSCDDCGAYYDSEGDRHYHEVINDYGHRPRARFYPDEQQPYYLGYELEVEVDEEDDKYIIAEDLLRRVNRSVTESKYLYLKEDGSLDNGFEIVTHPFTLEFHQQFDLSFLDKLREFGVRSWDRDTCGFHVHVSRNAFTARDFATGRRRYSKSHELRFTSLIYLNRQQFTKFAGRSSTDYASFLSDDTDSVAKHVLIKAKGQEHTRFQAVNIQNSNTVEVRIFKGTLRKERILANLEMVHACVEYTRSLNESVVKGFQVNNDSNAYDWSRFRSWLVANEKVYPNTNVVLNELSL